MKQSTKTERQSNADRRKASIAAVIEAALKLFVDQGYSATSVDQIAAAAGLTKGAVYFYFKDKEALLIELLERSECELYEPIFNELDGLNKSGVETLNKFLQLIGRAGAERDRGLLMLPILMSIEFSEEGDIVEERIQAMYTRTRRKLTEIIKCGQKDDTMRQDADPEAFASLIVSLTDGILIDLHRGGVSVSGASIAKASRQMIVRSLSRGS